MIESLVTIFVMAVITGISYWIITIAGLNWRRSLQRRLHHLYFQPMIPYRSNTIDQNCDNIDNRMTTDLKLLTEVTHTLYIPSSLRYYCHQLTGISL
jgi:ABC-type uncharacterized transport system fused permease/ATPase subunit